MGQIPFRPQNPLSLFRRYKGANTSGPPRSRSVASEAWSTTLELDICPANPIVPCRSIANRFRSPSSFRLSIVRFLWKNEGFGEHTRCPRADHKAYFFSLSRSEMHLPSPPRKHQPLSLYLSGLFLLRCLS